MSRVNEALARRLHQVAGAARWDVPLSVFTNALERSAAKVGATTAASPADIERHLGALHLNDLALACACAAGHDGAWEHFIREHRPVLYRAADAIDSTGGARETADALYAELYGLREHGGVRKSLFDYFHGRSSLGTWLRAILTQRHVDHLRARRRLEPLTEDEGAMPVALTDPPPDPDRARFLTLVRHTVAAAVATLAPRDRLRLGCYYGQEMTLAEIGRILGEHEATVSRHLTRTRRVVREDVERRMRDDYGLGDAEIHECLVAATTDAGPLNLSEWLGPGEARKTGPLNRSTDEDAL